MHIGSKRRNPGAVGIELLLCADAKQPHEGIQVGADDCQLVGRTHQRRQRLAPVRRSAKRRAIDESGQIAALRHVSRTRTP